MIGAGWHWQVAPFWAYAHLAVWEGGVYRTACGRCSGLIYADDGRERCKRCARARGLWA